MPMQLTEQYAFTSCSAVLCCETEMTVCGWSMCLNSAVQIRNNKQLEVLWTNKTLPLKSLQQCCLTFIATQAVCVPLVLRENHTAQSLPCCRCLTTPRQARVLLYVQNDQTMAVVRVHSVHGCQCVGVETEYNVSRSEALPAPR